MSDLRFDSPSGAAGFVGGAALNGRDRWKRGGRSLKEIEDSEIENAVQDR
ncbi:hypothetical protein [Actinomyces sp.]|nr:hypothetical protein [Actinomyces sp.]MDO4899641.1 hypothetical protein [Actinomyces sp.]